MKTQPMGQAVPLTSQNPWNEEDPLYEIVEGQRVAKPPMGNLATVIASNLTPVIEVPVRASGLGRAFAHMLFRFESMGENSRRPHVLRVLCKMAERTKGELRRELGRHSRSRHRNRQPVELG